MSRQDIASALDIDDRELGEIASGYMPDDEVAGRLRALATSGGTRRIASISVKAMVIFVVADALFFAILAAVLVLR